MKWQETVANKCRWSEYAQELFYDWDIVWDASVDDYQGTAKFIATKDGRYAYVCWSYGSCSGCDGWEGLPEEEVRSDFKNCVDYFESVTELEKWANFRNDDEINEFLKNLKDLFDEHFLNDFETYNVH